MKRKDLEHALRASSRICDEPVFVVIGSQAILGTYPEASEEAIVRSIEADVYPLYAPEKSELLNVIGWGSDFHNTFGYYVDGVDEKLLFYPMAGSLALRASRSISAMVRTFAAFALSRMILQLANWSLAARRILNMSQPQLRQVT